MHIDERNALADLRGEAQMEYFDSGQDYLMGGEELDEEEGYETDREVENVCAALREVLDTKSDRAHE